jgi:plastocyanin
VTLEVAAQTPGTRRGTELSWFGLVQVVGASELLLLLLSGAILLDKEALAFAAVVAVSLAWVWFGGGIVPVALRALIFLDVAAFMTPGAYVDITNHESVGAILITLALAVTSTTGLVGSIGFIAARGNRGAGASSGPMVLIAAALVFVAAVVVALLGGAGRQVSASSQDVTISMTGAKFSTTALHAHSGEVSVYVTNNDLFWHTFTIEQLGVDVKAPVKSHQRITFRAAPGTYVFRCSIPGHASIGMTGVLVVR